MKHEKLVTIIPKSCADKLFGFYNRQIIIKGVFMKKTTKVLSLVLAMGMVSGAFAGCNGGFNNNTSGDEMLITIMNAGGGVGQQWLDNAIERYKEKMSTHEWSNGQVGVDFEVTSQLDEQVETMGSAGYNIYFTEHTPTALELSQKNMVIPITDIVTEKSDTRDGQPISIEDKMGVQFRENVKGADGEYYALPHFSLFGGLTYDQDLFDTLGFYFAAPVEEQSSQDVVESFTCKYGDALFALKGAKKSCGNDGKYGTLDDGLPTTVQELFVLCKKMIDSGCEPLVVRYGMYYGYYLEEALWSALATEEEVRARFSYTGKVRIVDGYEDTPLFKGIDYIKTPKIKEVDVVPATGYLVNDSVARYYAIAIQEVLMREGWFSAYVDRPELTHIDMMKNFYYSGKNGRTKQGLFIEGDYWHNEAVTNGVVSEYEKVTKDKNRKLAWFPMPTALTGTVNENQGRTLCMLNGSKSLSFINANISDNAALVEACKDFLKFCYSDDELSAFTGCTGVGRGALNYKIKDEHKTDMYYFNKTVVETKELNNVVLLDKMDNIHYNNDIYSPMLGVQYTSSLAAFQKTSRGTIDVFNSRRTSESEWTLK